MRFLARLSTAAALLFCTGALSADELTDIQTEGQKLEKELAAAKAAFRRAWPTMPEYKQGKQRIAECQAEVAAAQAAKDSPRTDAAIKKKRAAEKELVALADELEARDPAVVKVNQKMVELNARAAPLYAKVAADGEQRKADAERELKAKRERYRSIVERDYKGDPRQRDSIPLLGDEISFAEPKANPKEFLGRPFIVCGAVEIRDYYNFGYDNAKATHFSLGISRVTEKARYAGDRASLYLNRKIGQSVIEILSKQEKHWPDAPWVMRVKMVMDPRYVRTYHDASDTYEMLDWQYLGKDGWSPWYSEIVDERP